MEYRLISGEKLSNMFNNGRLQQNIHYRVNTIASNFNTLEKVLPNLETNVGCHLYVANMADLAKNSQFYFIVHLKKYLFFFIFLNFNKT